VTAILTTSVTVAVLWNGGWCVAVIDQRTGAAELGCGTGFTECVMGDGLDARCLGVPGLVSKFEDN